MRYSIQSNHLHLIVEVDDKGALARGMQSLSVRIARGPMQAGAPGSEVDSIPDDPGSFAGAVSMGDDGGIVDVARRLFDRIRR